MATAIFWTSGLVSDIEGEWLRGRILARPEDEDAAGVGDWDAAVGEVCGDELLGMDVVGGEEEVLRIAVGDLLREGCRGTEGLAMILTPVACSYCGGEGGQDGLEIGGGGDVELFGRLRMRGWRPCEYHEKK